MDKGKKVDQEIYLQDAMATSLNLAELPEQKGRIKEMFNALAQLQDKVGDQLDLRTYYKEI